MARPRLGDSASERLHMVITADEVNAIEDWRFKNRVQSKSEAIRRLIQIGLRVEREMPELVKRGWVTANTLEAGIHGAKEIYARNPNEDSAPEQALNLFRNTKAALDRQMEALHHLFNLVNEISPFATNPELADALKAAEERKAEREEPEAFIASLKAATKKQKTG